MLRDKLINTATRIGIDGPLRSMRATLSPGHRHDKEENKRLRQMLEAALTENSNCIDVGAYRGNVLAELIRVAPHGKHIAFEPLPHMYRLLVERFPNVDIRQAAVSNQAGETSFIYVKNAPARSGFRERDADKQHPTEKLTVRTQTLDKDLPVGYVPALIKIDVEGAERFVLEGAIKTISRHKPMVIFEHGKGGADYYSTEPRQVFELLENAAGLHIFDFDGNGPYSLEQFEETYRLNTRWDFVAHL